MDLVEIPLHQMQVQLVGCPTHKKIKDLMIIRILNNYYVEERLLRTRPLIDRVQHGVLVI